MALTSGFAMPRRGARRGNSFGYPVAPGEQVWRGGYVCLNASGQIVRPQTSGAAVPGGICSQDYWNVGNSSPGAQNIELMEGCFPLTVPGATAANIGANVYATDDNTFTLTQPGSGFEVAIGVLAGIDNGQTYVLLARS